MPPAVDFRAKVEELRTLANSRPRPQDRQIVQDALDSKWEGLQSVAAQTLGRWGDRPSVAALREFWPQCAARRNHYLQNVVAHSLRMCVRAEDAPWFLDVYFEASASARSFDLLLTVVPLPLESVRERLLLEAQCTDRIRRQSAMLALAQMPFPNREAILSRFLNDEDGRIREQARFWIEQKAP